MLQTSGEIKFSQINAELGRNTGDTLSISDTTLRELVSRTTVGSEIKISNAYGKYTTTVDYHGTVIQSAALNPDGTYDNVLVWQSSGEFIVSGSKAPFKFLLVAGGAGGDYRYQSGGGGGGGGEQSYYQQLGDGNLYGTYTVTVGAGGVGNGSTASGASGRTTSLVGANDVGTPNAGYGTKIVSGGLPSGYNTGRNAGVGGGSGSLYYTAASDEYFSRKTYGGGNGGVLNASGTGGTGQTGITNDITGSSGAFGSGGGGGGRTGGSGGNGAGNGGGSYGYGGHALANRGAAGGGGGWYSGGTYYYGGNGGSGVFILRGKFKAHEY